VSRDTVVVLLHHELQRNLRPFYRPSAPPQTSRPLPLLSPLHAAAYAKQLRRVDAEFDGPSCHPTLDGTNLSTNTGKKKNSRHTTSIIISQEVNQ
jgi:hypothetical protein